MSDLDDRLELLEARYMTLRETVAKLEKVQYKIREQVGFIEYMAKAPDYPDSLETRFDSINRAMEIIKHHLGVYDEVPEEEHQIESNPESQHQPYSQPAPSQSAYIPSGVVPPPQAPISNTGSQVNNNPANIMNHNQAAPAPQVPINPVNKVREQVQSQVQNQMAARQSQDQTVYYQPGAQTPPPAPPPIASSDQDEYDEPYESTDTIRRKKNTLSKSRRKTVIRINPR